MPKGVLAATGLVLLLVLAGAALDAGALRGQAASPDGAAASCTAAQKANRLRTLKTFKRSMRPARRAYFRRHHAKEARRRFVQRQQAKLESLQRAAACTVVEVSGHLYWTNPIAGTIGRANLDGTGVNRRFITGVIAPGRQSIPGWRTNSEPGTIGRANLDGTGVDQSFIAASYFVAAVAVGSR